MGQRTDVIIDAISPTAASVSVGRLQYDSLSEAHARFGFAPIIRKNGAMLLERKIPTLDQVRQDFSVAYLLGASYRLQRSRTALERFFWTHHFSVSSIQLFGRPNNKAVAQLARHELKRFENIVDGQSARVDFAHPLLRTYRRLAKSSRAKMEDTSHFQQTQAAVREYFYQNYGEALRVFDVYDERGSLSPDDLFDSFSRSLELLKLRDSGWEKWQVVMTSSGNLAVSGETHSICIGKRRVPVPVREVRGLFAHEVLVHAMRAVNGEKLSRDLCSGLNDYLTAEEGLGVLVESAINGSLAYKVKDRYLDISLALGGYRRRAQSREELFAIAYIRSVLRSLDDGDGTSLDDIEKAAWQHVNRIYRGTLGNKYVGVFTKDIAYYEGLIAMSKYIAAQLNKKTIDEIMGYVLSGKFDPTNSKHEKVVKKCEKVNPTPVDT